MKLNHIKTPATVGLIAFCFALSACAENLQLDPRDVNSASNTSGSQTGGGQIAAQKAQMVPVYRSVDPVNQDWQYSTSINMLLPGYQLDRLAFHVYPDAGDGLIPLYLCSTLKNGKGKPKHFPSTMANCEGGTLEGMLGYLQAAPNAETHTAVYRCSKTGNPKNINIDNDEGLSGTDVISCKKTTPVILGYTL